jgi:hypothetical protein
MSPRKISAGPRLTGWRARKESFGTASFVGSVLVSPEVGELSVAVIV